MMKKILAILMSVSMLLLLASCGGKDETYEIIASYSVNSTEDDFMVYVQDLGGVYKELYDENGIHVKLDKEAKILDSEGNEISQSDLHIGDTLKISYSGKLVKKNPKTIKVYEITKY